MDLGSFKIEKKPQPLLAAALDMSSVAPLFESLSRLIGRLWRLLLEFKIETEAAQFVYQYIE
jgi:hypothetical protein